ncbi:calcium-binding protein [Mesorhizobium sp. AaZ16]|uniref:calcium-binding protein n=1 Tax=Mesorhizobium sp. AaZ16 TaxID=3402289 RepID=UPI00374F74B6
MSIMIKTPDGQAIATIDGLGSSYFQFIEDVRNNDHDAIKNLFLDQLNFNGSNIGDHFYSYYDSYVVHGAGGDDVLEGHGSLYGDDGNDTLTGGDQANSLYGGAGNDRLDGGAGADNLTGGDGNDTYIVDNAADEVVEGAAGGTLDWIATSVSYTLGAGAQIEKLSTASNGTTTAINLIGNEFAQTVVGNAGANLINGRGRSDVLYGYGGNDTFVFNTAIGPGNVDHIADYSAPDDKIRLENAVFTALSDVGKLAFSHFWSSTTGEAHDADDRVTYETDTGWLRYDADGAGGTAAIHFATLDANLDVTRNDFYVI